ncbi:hypothetical protein J4573_29930 [Actinomadura barringtoniae]|uniref:Uncharacterized protein n=1 Tax=Actinomadura barringtoniae TaxID=1427535 RepID=A0A939TCK3_9ACTN|nr:hypothetical protein [Actinomadura barringtoniae]MBO2451345.1 hypothetical protein [Actinomadura barringtoniae]
MITMKAATIAAAAIGAVGAISGVTWAATGSPVAGLTGAHDKAPAAVQQVKDAVPPAPATLPTCLPTDKLPKVPTDKLPKDRLPKVPTDKLPKVPTDKLPKVPADKLPKPPADKLPKLPTDKLPNPTQPGNPGTPGTPAPGIPAPGAPAPMPQPTCLPDASRLPKPPADKLPGNPADKLPKPGVPGVPGAPKLPKNVDCSKLPAPVQVGGTVEKALILTKGLNFTGVQGPSVLPGATKDVKVRKICAITQKWVGAAGRYITIERLMAPAGTTERQLRQALALPATGPLPGGGVLMFDPNGSSLLTNASSLLTSDLPELASAVQQAR